MRCNIRAHYYSNTKMDQGRPGTIQRPLTLPAGRRRLPEREIPQSETARDPTHRGPPGHCGTPMKADEERQLEVISELR